MNPEPTYNLAGVPEDPGRIPTPQPPTDVVDTAQPSDPAAVREVFRAKHRLAVSVMERPQQFTVAYSLARHSSTHVSVARRTHSDPERVARLASQVRAAECARLLSVACRRGGRVGALVQNR